MNNPATLIIKLNKNINPNDCPLCGEITNPNIGAELFLAGSETIVCLDCAMKHAPILACLLTFADISRVITVEKPILADLLTFAELSELHQRAEEIFGAKWEQSEGFRKSSMNAYQDFGFITEVKNAA
jgi:hypothetical protein